jgi:hypothetical protein
VALMLEFCTTQLISREVGKETDGVALTRNQEGRYGGRRLQCSVVEETLSSEYRKL